MYNVHVLVVSYYMYNLYKQYIYVELPAMLIICTSICSAENQVIREAIVTFL